MIRYTDARLVLTITGVSLADATDIHVTFKQRNTVLDITNAEVTESGLIVHLTQEQTKMFKTPPTVTLPLCSVQVNMMIDGKRVATDIANVNIGEQLLEVVLDE